MKITISGVTYDTDASEKIAHKATVSLDEQLHRTCEGEFFLLVLQLNVDGKPLGPYECWVDMKAGGKKSARLSVSERIVPISQRDALIWCIKTQIPRTFRGLLLESI